MSVEIELGDEVKCKITGLKGIATAHAKHLTGCDRILIQPAIHKDGKMADGYWTDAAAIDVLKKNKVKANDVQENGPKAKRGGPMDKFK